MTKHIPDESIQKCPLGLDEANKIVETTAKAMDSHALFICGTHVNPAPEDKLRITKVKTRIHSLKTKVGKAMQRLYDIESGNEPEKPLKIDFNVDLYQMEDI